jgi:hypothetical protein
VSKSQQPPVAQVALKLSLQVVALQQILVQSCKEIMFYHRSCTCDQQAHLWQTTVALFPLLQEPIATDAGGAVQLGGDVVEAVVHALKECLVKLLLGAVRPFSGVAHSS